MLESIQSIVEELPVAEDPVIIPQDTFAVAVQEVNETAFMMEPPSFSVNLEGFTFGNISTSPINPNSLGFGGSNMTAPPIASVNLPSNLLSFTNDSLGPVRITNALYLTDALFLRRNSNESFQEVGSIIIAASVVNQTIQGLDPPINLVFLINSV